MTLRSARFIRLLRSVLDPRAYLHALRIINFFNYAHVAPRRLMTLGPGVRLSPTASFRNGDNITIGARTHVGEAAMLWAGESTEGSIAIGGDCLIGPGVMLTAANYSTSGDKPMREQPKHDASITVGNNVWIGAHAVITAGVAIGDGAIVGAGAVVTRDVDAATAVGGVPAIPIRARAIVNGHHSASSRDVE